MSDNKIVNEMFEKYGINDVYIGYTRYAPDGTIEHACAVHVEYRDGRTICITDKGVLEGVQATLKIRNVDGTQGG